MKTFKKYTTKYGYQLLRMYWFLVRPKSEGAKCLVLHNNKRVLLIRQSYTPQWWSLPGGRIEKEETPTETMARELEEEVGLTMALHFLGTVYTEREYKKDTIHLFFGETESVNTTVDEVEVIEARWFLAEELPRNLWWTALEALRLYEKYKKQVFNPKNKKQSNKDQNQVS